MFSKPFQKLDFQDIHDLIHLIGIREGNHLDFKEKIDNPDKFKTVL